jgi:two-component sensor histidine kinase
LSYKMINLKKPQKINSRLIIIIGSLLIMSGIIIVVLLNYSMRRDALEGAEEKAKIILDRNLATHTYFSRQLKPDVFELINPLESEEYFKPSWMSSTYSVREIDKYFKSLNGSEYYYKESAINARSIENEADEYKAAFLKKINKEPDFSYQANIRTIDDKPYFTFLRRGEVMEEGCLKCHSTPEKAPADLVKIYGSERSFNRNVGDVVSAISIRVPIIIPYEHAKELTIQFSAIFLVAVLLLFAFQFWFNKQYILSPVDAIRNQAFQITHDETKLGDEIPLSKSKELNDLIESFNLMSKNLGQSRDLLLDRVKKRTIDLSTANENLKKEVNDRKQAEEQIKKSLKEKETLLNEIHHRVKNNLTVVSSLLGLQANRMNDEKLTVALMDSKNRVQSMSTIHETLYQSDNLSSIDMNTYLSNLSRAVSQNYTIDSSINLEIEAENIFIGTKQASPIGLIVNELITNSFKYAFPENRDGEIRIKLHESGSQIELEYSDDGVGFSEELDWKNSNTLGLKLVRTLVENQLDGLIDMESNNGTKFIIKFNIET